MADLIQLALLDPDPQTRLALRKVLSPTEYQIQVIQSLGEAASADLLVVDYFCISHAELREFCEAPKSPPVIVLLLPPKNRGALQQAIRHLRCLGSLGTDVLLKPLGEREDADGLVHAVKGALAARDLKRQAADLYGQVPSGYLGVIGQSPVMQSLLREVQQASTSRVPVLLLGESGTGKELIAKILHFGRTGPYVTLNCATLSESLAESELFGHTKGAFTGAERSHRGLFSQAHGGTLFLDEVSELPLSVQVKLLRAIQEGEIRPLGQSAQEHVEVRLLAATNQDLSVAVSEKRFREDLYYRLAVLTLRVPPLRERVEDIPALAYHFLNLYGAGRFVQIEEEALSALCAYRFPGNVRELENVIERATVLSSGPNLTFFDLPIEIQRAKDARDLANLGMSYSLGRQLALSRFETTYLTNLLRSTKGNITEAARLGGLDRAYLKRLLQKCQISAESFRATGNT